MGALIAIRGAIALIPAAVWKWLAVAVILVASHFYVYEKGNEHAKAVCEEKARQAQVAADTQDKQAGTEVQTQDNELTAQLQAQKVKDDAAIEDLKSQLAKKPGDPQCVYGPTNGDPAKPDAGKLRVPVPRPRAGNEKHPGTAKLPATR